MARKKIVLEKLDEAQLEEYGEFVDTCIMARHQYRWSQKVMADKVGVSRNTYNAFETMRSVPLKVRLISKKLGIAFPRKLAK